MSLDLPGVATSYAIQSNGVQKSFRSATRGTTIKGIPREDLVQILIPLPPLFQG